MPNHPPKNPGSPFASMAGHHVAVRVPDYETGKMWYTEKLDFRVLHEWPYGGMQLAYLGPPDDDNFHVELLAGAGPEMPPVYDDIAVSLGRGGYHHFCMRVESVDETLAELRRRGVTVIGEPFEVEDTSSRLGFFTDPWGNMIEIAQDLR
jgi:lactoylglutathione lyase/glyoxylase I family protein